MQGTCIADSHPNSTKNKDIETARMEIDKNTETLHMHTQYFTAKVDYLNHIRYCSSSLD